MDLVSKFFRMIVYGILFAFVGSIFGAVAAVIVIITLVIPGTFLLELLFTGHIIFKWDSSSYSTSVFIIGYFAAMGNLWGLGMGIFKGLDSDYY